METTMYENEMMETEVQEEQGFFGRNKSEIITGTIAALVAAATTAVGMYLANRKSFEKFAEETNNLLDQVLAATDNGFRMTNGEEVNTIDLLRYQIGKIETNPDVKLTQRQKEVAGRLLSKAINLSVLVNNEEYTMRVGK